MYRSSQRIEMNSDFFPSFEFRTNESCLYVKYTAYIPNRFFMDTQKNMKCEPTTTYAKNIIFCVNFLNIFLYIHLHS